MAHTVLCKVGIQRHKPHPNQDPETPEAIPTRLVQIAFPDAEGQEYQSEQDLGLGLGLGSTPKARSIKVSRTDATGWSAVYARQ